LSSGATPCQLRHTIRHRTRTHCQPRYFATACAPTSFDS
jgi:hypothetical protein